MRNIEPPIVRGSAINFALICFSRGAKSMMNAIIGSRTSRS